MAKEFKLCKNIGFNGIEWLLDEVNISKSLLNETEKILDLINKYNISIQTICLHFLLDVNIKNIEEYFKILNANFSSVSLTCKRIVLKILFFLLIIRYHSHRINLLNISIIFFRTI